LDLEQENIGRRRKIYSITEDGMAALRKWLAEPVGEPFQLRNAAEIKLLFSELAQADEIVELAREQVRLHEERMDEYEAIVQRFSDDESVATRLVPLELGIQLERTALEFWRGLAEGQKAAPPTEKQTGRP